jgi:tetratricopeptide (TPR) repeat protein
MKRLDRSLDIGPMYATEFARAGIKSLRDLAKVSDVEDLGRRTQIPPEMIQRWRDEARQKIQVSRYRSRVATGIVLAAVAALGWLLSGYVRQSPAAISQRAAALYDHGDYKGALRLYDDVIRINPKFELAWANRGGALRNLHRPDEALASFNKALELDPSDAWTYHQRGELSADRGDYAGAIDDYDKAIGINPTYQLTYSAKGFALYQMKRYDDAVQVFDKALELKPGDVWAYDVRGNVYADSGKYQRALQDYDKAIALDPKYASAYGSKGFVLHKLGRYKDALNALNKALELDPTYSWAYGERGDLYQDDLHQYEAAYQDFKKACELAPNELSYRSNLAEAALTSGRLQEALDRAAKMLADNENTDVNKFEISERMSMRLIAISALLLQHHSEEARAKLREFISYYKAAPPNFERNWSYAGTRHFIEGSAMDGNAKRMVLSLIQLLEQPPKTTIERIEGMVLTLT